ncbi:hypothetical protein O181_066332 [Austropuccinia psidii MF-1]|uniref:Uncharacterized protein n=1 Tax=Austropuccinia psidii MF-1 TaxID=1389203 RepID=A0A9Q3I474_9BASI|nr:hypothetical protein [Austropuccinia psidii MF-1]
MLKFLIQQLNPFKPLPIFLNLAAFLLPAFTNTLYLDDPSCLDFWEGLLSSTTLDLDNAEKPSGHYHHHLVSAESQAALPISPVYSELNWRINNNPPSQINTKDSSTITQQSRFNFDGSQPYQTGDQQLSLSEPFRNQAQILAPTQVTALNNGNYISSSSNSQDQNTLEKLVTIKPTTHHIAQHLQNQVDLGQGDQRPDLQFNLGSKLNSLSSFSHPNLLNKPQGLSFNSFQIRKYQVSTQPSVLFPFNNKATIEIPRSINVMDLKASRSYSTPTQTKKISKAIDSSQNIDKQIAEFEHQPAWLDHQKIPSDQVFPQQNLIFSSGNPTELDKKKEVVSCAERSNSAQSLNYPDEQSIQLASSSEKSDDDLDNWDYEINTIHDVINTTPDGIDQTNDQMDTSHDELQKSIAQPDQSGKLNTENDPKIVNTNKISQKSLISQAYEKLGEKKSQVFRDEIDAFLTSLQITYSSQTPKEDFVNENSFKQILFFVIKASLVRSEIYALLNGKLDGEQHEELRILQKDTFEFLRYFWKLALTNVEDEKNKYFHMKKDILTPTFLNKARRAFEAPAAVDIRGKWASWYAITAFVRMHWGADLTEPQKRFITSEVLALRAVDHTDSNEGKLIEENLLNTNQIPEKTARASFFDHTMIKGTENLKIFDLNLADFVKSITERYENDGKMIPRIGPNNIKHRISYAITASFLQIILYATTGWGGELKEAADDRLPSKVFQLLKYFWELALFEEADVPSDLHAIAPYLPKSYIFQEAKTKLKLHGPPYQKGEMLSWYTTKLVIRWLWGKELMPKQRTQIKTNIRSTQAHGDELNRPEISRTAPTYRKLTRICTDSLGGQALKDCGIELSEFLRSILIRYKKNDKKINHEEKKRILQRLSYAIKASFLQIQFYSEENLRGKLSEEAKKNLSNRTFKILQYFWELALFDEGDPPPNEDKKLGNIIKQSESFNNALDTLKPRRGNEQMGHTAAWHTTTFLVKWFWKQDLNEYQKGLIHKKIQSKAKENS